MFGDIIASGWLTCALSARLLVKGYMNDSATLGGNGMDEVRWHQPVYAGDELSVHVELVDKAAGDNPQFGHTTVLVTTTNQRDEEVLTMYGLGLVEKRGDE
jgi:acyl dehydratase